MCNPGDCTTNRAALVKRISTRPIVVDSGCDIDDTIRTGNEGFSPFECARHRHRTVRGCRSRRERCHPVSKRLRLHNEGWFPRLDGIEHVLPALKIESCRTEVCYENRNKNGPKEAFHTYCPPMIPRPPPPPPPPPPAPASSWSRRREMNNLVVVVSVQDPDPLFLVVL